MTRFNFKNFIPNKFVKDTSGQFSILFAVSASVLMLGSAAAIDTAGMHKAKSRINDIADSAALAGASASEMNNAQRVQIVKDYIEANSDPSLLSKLKDDPVVTFNDAEKDVTVEFTVNTKPLWGKVLGKSVLPVSTKSVASYADQSVTPVSIAFALDVSGSMNWNTSDGNVKINALKDSVSLLYREIEAEMDNPADLQKSLRSGMSAYSTVIKKRLPMEAGWYGLDTAVKQLSAGGGTNSTASLQYAYDQIKADRQYRAANQPHYNPSLAKEYVIFMTDGDNNNSAWDASSYNVCAAMQNDGIEVFTIAFAAPQKGQALLMDCASRNDLSAISAGGETCRGTYLSDPNSNGMADCQQHILPSKDAHFFDAGNAAAFKDAFRDIGKTIVERGVRIKS